MVHLSRIYTKTGDDGTTALGNGQRVSKDDARVEAYGEVDELNTILGLLVAHHPQVDELPLLQLIQNDLFDVGADLCTPQPAEEKPNERLRVTAGQVLRLEEAIDRLNAGLPPLSSFVLPGGQPAAAWCHQARAVCRRAERRVVHLMKNAFVNQQVLLYLNRLSDLLFVLCRHLNGRGVGDVLWQPGKGRAH